MRREVRSVSKALSCQNNFHHWKPAAEPHGVNKVRWLTATASTGYPGERREGKGRGLIGLLKLYCDNSSLAGYKYITEIERTWFERILWILLHLIMICILGVIIWNILQDYKNTPVITTVDSDHYPSNLLDFPAISVCSLNRISRRAAIDLAKHIIFMNITNIPIEKILLIINNLGNLYESSYKSNNRNASHLEYLLKNYVHSNYQLARIMKELAPKCSDIFLRCRFRATDTNCSELFSFRKTQDGYCCLFNYVRDDEINDGGNVSTKRRKDPFKIEKLSMLNSLTFLIDPFLDDYFYTILPLTGWKIMIFNPNDYPDNTSGGVTETLISLGTENFLELNAVSFFTEKAVRNFDIRDRKCIFKDEISTLYKAYTYSDCIVDCKIKDIWKRCGCQPFFYPIRDSHRFCTASDTPCLHYHKTRWWSVMPHYMNEESEESKTFNSITNSTWSLRCKRCYPSCEDVRYSLQTSSIVLRNDGQTSLLKNINIVNHSLVHIFFSKYGTLRLKQDRTYYWYELLSDIGGLCGVFIGFSLISAVEFIYFLVVSSTNLCPNTGISKSLSDRQEYVESNNIRPLYWAELKPRGKSVNVKTRARVLNFPYSNH